MRVLVARPADGGSWPGLAMYSDIFALTESTQRMAVRLAGYGHVVAAPEIYWRHEPPGTAFPFDDAGRSRGMERTNEMTTAEFDEDIAALRNYLRGRADVCADALGAVGFCLGGHIAFRAAFAADVKATACFYPTGLHDGKLGRDDARSLGGSKDIKGALLLVFGADDPHTSSEDRAFISGALEDAHTNLTVELFPAQHAFMRDVGPRYDPQAADAAFAAAISMFDTAFRTKR